MGIRVRYGGIIADIQPRFVRHALVGDQRAPLGRTRTLGNIIDLLDIETPVLHHEKDEVVRARGERVLDKILVVLPRTDDALAAALL